LISTPNAIATKAVTRIVPPTCSPPPMKTVFLIFINPLKDNSIPIIKRRKIIPISESNSTSWEELNKLKALGPTIIPANKKPNMEGTLSFWKAKIITIEMPKTTTNFFE